MKKTLIPFVLKSVLLMGGITLPLLALDLSILETGAVPDGQKVNTKQIQKCIDQVSQKGGGKVIVPKGQYVTGTLYLKDHVTLFLAPGAEILGSQSLADYPLTNPGSGEVTSSRADSWEGVLPASEFIQALIVADQAQNVSIEGAGTIDGRGSKEAFPYHVIHPTTKEKTLGMRPMLMRFFKCANVKIEGVQLKNPASWGVHLVDLDSIHIRGVKIVHRSNANNDGIDIDGCRNVFISDSDISSGDDAICPKSSHGRPCENIFVKNCVVSSDTAAFKLGTSSRAGFKNIVVSDCLFKNVGMGAIKLLCVDGGTLENILIHDILMVDVEGPIFVRLGNRGSAYKTPEPGGAPVPVGTLRNVTISNIKAFVSTKDKSRSGVMITGIPGHKISGLNLSCIDLVFPGMGAAPSPSKPVPEDEKKYPEQFFFGELPSYGMFIRHAEGIDLDQIQLRYEGEENRPALVLEDVQGLTLRNSSIHASGSSVIRSTTSRDLSLIGNRIHGTAGSLVECAKSEMDEIYLKENRLPKSTQDFLKMK